MAEPDRIVARAIFFEQQLQVFFLQQALTETRNSSQKSGGAKAWPQTWLEQAMNASEK